MKETNLFGDILLLPFISREADYCVHYEKIISRLEERKYLKSLEYIKKLHFFRHKWATAYLPQVFAANIQTTNRIESTNAAIKRYVNSTSKVSEMLGIPVDFEEKLILKAIADVEKKKEEMNSLLQS